MPFRFRRRIRLAPGVAINLSKSAPSLSLGGRGRTLNLNTRGWRATFSLVGTGLSWMTGRRWRC